MTTASATSAHAGLPPRFGTRAMRSAQRLVHGLCLAATFLLAQSARADESWLAFRGTTACRGEHGLLATRIAAAVAGVRDPALRVEVTIGSATYTTALVQLLLGARVLGSKQLEAATCDEALDAVVAVAALALSSSAQEEARPLAQEPVLVRTGAAEHELLGEQRSTRIDTRARPVSRRDDDSNERSPRSRGRVLGAVGLDVGTLARPTLVVAGGGALTLGRAELRLVGRYGLPSTEEEVSGDFRSLRRDFGAATVDSCWGLDRARWLSACGGVELSFRRSIRVVEALGEPRREEKRLSPAFGLLAGFSFVLREVAAQPQLELSAQLPLVGRPPALGFRAALGGGVLF